MAKRRSVKAIVARVVIALALVLCLALAGVVVYYSNNYYHADGTALASEAQATCLWTDPDELAFGDESSKTAIVLYPGGQVEYSAYAPLAQSLSEEGYLVIVPKMPLNLAFLGMGEVENAMAQYPGVEHWYLAGHSLGGVAAGFWAGSAGNAAKLDGLILLASYVTCDLSQSGLKTLCVYGSNDGVMNREGYAQGLSNLSASNREVVIEGANHSQFGNYGTQDGDGQASIAAEEQQDQTVMAIKELVEG